MRISQYTDVWHNPIVVIPVDKTHAAICQHVTAPSGVICTYERYIDQLTSMPDNINIGRVYSYDTIFSRGI